MVIPLTSVPLKGDHFQGPLGDKASMLKDSERKDPPLVLQTSMYSDDMPYQDFSPCVVNLKRGVGFMFLHHFIHFVFRFEGATS